MKQVAGLLGDEFLKSSYEVDKGNDGVEYAEDVEHSFFELVGAVEIAENQHIEDGRQRDQYPQEFDVPNLILVRVKMVVFQKLEGWDHREYAEHIFFEGTKCDGNSLGLRYVGDHHSCRSDTLMIEFLMKICYNDFYIKEKGQFSGRFYRLVEIQRRVRSAPEIRKQNKSELECHYNCLDEIRSRGKGKKFRRIVAIAGPGVVVSKSALSY